LSTLQISLSLIPIECDKQKLILNKTKYPTDLVRVAVQRNILSAINMTASQKISLHWIFTQLCSVNTSEFHP
jgi:hypothetical protein